MLVRCIARFFDSKRGILFEIGDTSAVKSKENPNGISPLEPAAMYFTGWSPGTKVYTKKSGVEGTRTVPGVLPLEDMPTLEVKEELPDVPLDEMTAVQLKEIAKDLKIPKYGSMNKGALIYAIKQQRGEGAPEE